ncbi:flavodoxin family protein [Streptomyces sp. NPDC002588]|uniref:flavodoxin family protein n=1 Tax=Streptomyces sp. NPDC002588 TaxID=3154419 RepID=UPI00331FF189
MQARHTVVLAEAVRAGAVDAGAEVHLIKVDEITEDQWALLDGSDAIVFGSPTYMGTASGAFHAFAEATSARWATQAWKDKPAAGFTNSGSKSGDKLHTLQFFQILAAQLGMHVDEGAEAVHKADAATAEHLGRRVAETARVFLAGRAQAA